MPTVGILLCAGKNEAVVRYARRGAAQPMAISTYTYESLPPAEREAVPDVDKLTHALRALVDAEGEGDDDHEPPAPQTRADTVLGLPLWRPDISLARSYGGLPAFVDDDCTPSRCRRSPVQCNSRAENGLQN